MVRVRGARGRRDVGPRAGAGVNEFLSLQFLQGDLVEREPFGLNDDFAVPVEAEPAEVFECLLRGAGLDPRRIDVFDSQAHHAAARAGRQPRDEIGARVADVLRASR